MGYMSKISKKNLIIIAVVGVLLIAGIIFYVTQIKTGEKPPKVLTSQEAGDKVIKYINENLLQGKAQVSLVSITTENELYRLKLKVEEEEFDAYVTKDGKFLFFQAPLDLDQKPPTAQEPGGQEKGTLTIGDFLISKDEICKENGKPIVYFFGSSGCPHCKWEHPVVENIASKFKENIVFRNNMDSDSDAEVFGKYSAEGYVPALVLGCKYYRVGSGEQAGQENESKVLTALICKLTENKPEDVCGQVQDLINQIPER